MKDDGNAIVIFLGGVAPHMLLDWVSAERLYLPLAADFLWSPTEDDRLTIRVLLSSEQATRTGGIRVRENSRARADALHAKSRTVITVKFSDSAAEWSMFVEAVDIARAIPDESRQVDDAYVATLVCRRLS